MRDTPLDHVLNVELGGAQWQPFGLELAGEAVLAQIGTVVGPLVLGADHHDATNEALLAQRLDGRRRGRARTDDGHDADRAGSQAYMGMVRPRRGSSERST